MARKASNMSTADWRYQTYLQNIAFFYVSCWDFSQGWKSLYNTIVYMIKQVLTSADGLGIATKGTCYKETFSDKIKKKTKIMEIFISDCLVFFSWYSHFFEGNICSLVFAVLIHTKFWFPNREGNTLFFLSI